KGSPGVTWRAERRVRQASPAIDTSSPGGRSGGPCPTARGFRSAGGRVSAGGSEAPAERRDRNPTFSNATRPLPRTLPVAATVPRGTVGRAGSTSPAAGGWYDPRRSDRPGGGRSFRRGGRMDATKARLGRGLDALIGGGDKTGKVPVDKIRHNPYQPRKRFDEDELKHLTDSVKAHGILQPLVVRHAGDHFQLIAGERRLRAAQAAGLKEVPVHVVAFDDQQVYEAALVENIQRWDLSPVEKAQGFKDYLDRFGLTQEQLGAKLGLDRTTVSNLLGLLNLPDEVQNAVRLGQISMGHAKVLKGVADAERQVQLC